MSNYYFSKLGYYTDSLKRFIRSDKPLMLVIGQPGSGKKQALESFCQQTTSHRILEIQADANMQPRDMINLLCQHWQLRPPAETSSSSYRKQLDHLLNEISQQQTPSVLIIHYAQTLRTSTLAALAHLSNRQQSPPISLHLILAGAVSLEDKISNLMAQMPPSLLMQALTHKETSHYIQYRLNKLCKNKPITPNQKVIDTIFQQSGGYPNLINQLIEQWLQKKTHHKKRTIKPSAKPFWRQHAIKTKTLSVAAIALAAAGLWYQHHSPRTPRIRQTKIAAIQANAAGKK